MEEKKLPEESAAAVSEAPESSENRASAAGSSEKRRGAISKLLLAAGVLCLLIYFLKSIPPPAPAPVEPPEISSSSGQSSSAPQQEGAEPVFYPEGEILLTDQREAYKDGELLLSVPRLGLEDQPVLNGDSFTVLADGIGLYDYSCLPGEAANANVSIIAHRDVAGQEFYYIDTLVPGDLIYLKYKGVLYTYEHKDTVIIKPNNLDIVPCGESPMVTLVSCHPIGTTFRRIVARCTLISAETLE